METKVTKLMRDQERQIRLEELREMRQEYEHDIRSNIDGLHETLDLLEECFEGYKGVQAKLQRLKDSDKRPWQKPERPGDPLSALDEQKKKIRQALWEYEAQIKATLESVVEMDEE